MAEADKALDISTSSDHLWESANILRGPFNAADLKTYTFPLLFFKRISDVFDEGMTVGPRTRTTSRKSSAWKNSGQEPGT